MTPKTHKSEETAIRRIALAYPNTREDHPWGETAFKVKDKAFIFMRCDEDGLSIGRLKELAREGFYDGTPFHRVIPGFMAQGGDPTGTGTGGSGRNLPAEFNDIRHDRGTVSMARSANPNSADSQFFICFAPAPHLDGQYTAFGQVIEGMEFVDRIKKGDAAGNGLVSAPQDRIVKMSVAADAQ